MIVLIGRWAIEDQAAAMAAGTRRPYSFARVCRYGSRWLSLAILCLLAQSVPAAESGVGEFPTYTRAAEITSVCTTALKEAALQERRIADGQGEAQVLIAMDRLNQLAEDRIYPIAFLANVHPDKKLRDAAEACDLRYSAFSSRLLQNPRIHARIKALSPVDGIDAQTREDLLFAFEDAGVALPPAARERARALNDELARLSQRFERRVREDRSRLAFTEAELDGVPPDAWRKAPVDASGRRVLGLDDPTYGAIAEGARNPLTRERAWRAYVNRGGEANLRTLARIGQQRRAYAALFGLESYADFVLRRRMAREVVRVQAFLDEVKDKVAKRELRDIADLRAAKAADLGSPLDVTVLNRWDVAFYTERVKRERFALDQNSFRPYFPPEASVDFVMAVAGRMFDVGFRAVPRQLWHPDAKAYEMFDLRSRDTLAMLYLDLYPRADKYGHAAVWGLRGSSTLNGRLPAAALVTNFHREGLTLDELETLIHEFGHALHQTLSTTRYSSNAGTSVKLDFVEAPSQMLEEWIYDAKVLALFGQVCASCKPVPPDLLQRAVQSRSFGKGLQFARQHLFASFDLALHAKDAPEPMATWERMEAATPLGFEKGSRFPASFEHLVGGYGAGYYAYLWSLATAQDLRTAFEADPLDPAVGHRYRDTVLANGGQVDPNELVSRFLGRPQGNEAFFKWLDR
jgi:thimet oligopeptidase